LENFVKDFFAYVYNSKKQLIEVGVHSVSLQLCPIHTGKDDGYVHFLLERTFLAGKIITPRIQLVR
jgi:hypothetical protein